MKKVFIFIGIIGILFSIASLIPISNKNDIYNRQTDDVVKQAVRKEIHIPDIDEYKTLKCDFHMHTVFSDGLVWPTIRVEEAWQEGLDAIAITDHIEYQPHSMYIMGSLNSPYEIAKEEADKKGIILIKGAEITRDMPPGHLNVLFINDIDKLVLKDSVDAIMEAYHQGAFIFWNHPGWKAQQPDSCIMFPIHRSLIEKGIIHGIEVFNEKEWYPVALDWCINLNLTVLGNSDIHGITEGYYDLEKFHRPMTLVFATDKSSERIKEALFNGRTVAWFGKHVIGKEEFLIKLFKNSVSITKKKQVSKATMVITLKNKSDFIFELTEENGPLNFVLMPNETKDISVKKDQEFLISNWFSKSNKNPRVKVEL